MMKVNANNTEGPDQRLFFISKYQYSNILQHEKYNLSLVCTE